MFFYLKTTEPQNVFCFKTIYQYVCFSRQATDTGTPSSLSSSVFIHIQVLDVNDNVPEFIDLPQMVHVSRTLPVKSQASILFKIDYIL